MHGANVEGDILSGGAVTARHAAGQLAIFVSQGERHAVELQFADVVDVAAAAELVHASLPAAQFFLAVSVVEREHGRRVADLDESLARFAADALSGGIGRDEFRVLGLEVFQLLGELVEFLIADFRSVEHEVLIFVVANFLAESFDLFFGVFWGRHRRNYRRERRRRDSAATTGTESV